MLKTVKSIKKTKNYLIAMGLVISFWMVVFRLLTTLGASSFGGSGVGSGVGDFGGVTGGVVRSKSLSRSRRVLSCNFSNSFDLVVPAFFESVMSKSSNRTVLCL